MTCAAVLLLTLPAAAQGTTLRYRWTAGQDDRYRLTQKTTATVSGVPGGGPESMVVEQTITQIMRLRVSEIAADGTATLQQTFESMRFEMTGPTGPILFDSSTKERPADPTMAGMADMLGATVGQTLTVVLRPNGEVVKVEGMDKVLDKMTASIPADGPMAAMANSLKAGFTDEAVRRMFSQSFAGFPAGPIAPGGTWSGTFEMTQPIIGTVSSVRTYTLSGIDSGAGAQTARIAVVSTSKQTAESAPNPIGMTVTMGEAKGSGETLFDVTNGRIQRSVVNSDMPMTMRMTGPDGQSATIQNNAHSTLTMELIPR